MAGVPARIIVTDDLRRSRLTVFFRLLLAIPHLVWLALWTVAAFLAAIGNWFATLATGRSPELLYRFLAAYIRYSTHVSAFVFLAANPFPGFTGAAGSYPIDGSSASSVAFGNATPGQGRSQSSINCKVAACEASSEVVACNSWHPRKMPSPPSRRC